MRENQLFRLIATVSHNSGMGRNDYGDYVCETKAVTIEVNVVGTSWTWLHGTWLHGTWLPVPTVDGLLAPCFITFAVLSQEVCIGKELEMGGKSTSAVELVYYVCHL